MKLYAMLFAFLFTLTSLSLQAQKYAYINSSQIIMMHPDVKSADQKLLNYQNELISIGEGMAKKLESNYNAYVVEANSGTLSKIQMQDMESGLAQEQEAIQRYEVEIQQKILAKREELYQPILNEIQTAVEAVGKENGYLMIFDTSTGGILHAKESENIFEKVKSKLGL